MRHSSPDVELVATLTVGPARVRRCCSDVVIHVVGGTTNSPKCQSKAYASISESGQSPLVQKLVPFATVFSGFQTALISPWFASGRWNLSMSLRFDPPTPGDAEKGPTRRRRTWSFASMYSRIGGAMWVHARVPTCSMLQAAHDLLPSAFHCSHQHGHRTKKRKIYSHESRTESATIKHHI